MTLHEPLLTQRDSYTHPSIFSLMTLLFTICLETSGTLLLKNALHDYYCLIGAYVCYFGGLTLFAFVLRDIPLSIAYTTWCAVGSILVTLFSHIFYMESMSFAKLLCIIGTIPLVIGLYILP